MGHRYRTSVPCRFDRSTEQREGTLMAHSKSPARSDGWPRDSRCPQCRQLRLGGADRLKQLEPFGPLRDG